MCLGQPYFTGAPLRELFLTWVHERPPQLSGPLSPQSYFMASACPPMSVPSPPSPRACLHDSLWNSPQHMFRFVIRRRVLIGYYHVAHNRQYSIIIYERSQLIFTQINVENLSWLEATRGDRCLEWCDCALSPRPRNTKIMYLFGFSLQSSTGYL